MENFEKIRIVYDQNRQIMISDSIFTKVFQPAEINEPKRK